MGAWTVPYGIAIALLAVVDPSWVSPRAGKPLVAITAVRGADTATVAQGKKNTAHSKRFMMSI